MTTTLADIPVLRQQCSALREQHRQMRRAQPRVRLWTNKPDSSPGLILRGEVRDSVNGKFPFRKNTPATATLRLRLDHALARWLVSIPNDPDAKKNIVVTCDSMGGTVRWSGLLKNWKIVRDSNGLLYLDVTFIDDLQFLQFMLGPPNPLLPIPIFQFPRVLPLFGPSKWCISILILLQLIRLEGNLWTPADDPFESGSAGDMSNWQVLIKANAFDLDDSSLWTILATRMNRVDNAIADALDDAQLVLTYRRILTVDGETCPVDGVDCANGTLVLEVVDKSGYWSQNGTGTGGGIAAGFDRTVQGFLAGFVEDTQTLVTDDETVKPDEYYQPGYLGTVPEFPWIVVRDSQWTTMETSQLTWAPATAVRVIVGGDNPIADQLMKLTIESIGALIGYFLLAGFSDLGSIASDIVAPFLVGTILAWLEWQNHTRAHDLGWVHLPEIYQTGAENNAWSLSAIAALRSGFLSTKSETAHQFSMGMGGQFLPGLHFSIGDRIGSTVAYVNDVIFVDQVEEMTLSWDWSSGKSHDWSVTVGTAKAAMSQGERSARLLNKALQTLSNIGVHLLS